MKKYILTMLLFVIGVNVAEAQNFTKSYGCIGVTTSIGPQAPPTGLAVWIEFYDDYIMVDGIEKFTYGGKNLDGSIKYWATKQGAPALNTIGWVISKNYSSAKQVIQSSMMGMTMQMDYHYNYIGEGTEPAQRMMEGANSQYGYNDDN